MNIVKILFKSFFFSAIITAIVFGFFLIIRVDPEVSFLASLMFNWFFVFLVELASYVTNKARRA